MTARLRSLGWDDRTAAAFEPHATAGRRPARVVAVHRETSIVAAETGDRRASVTGRLRHEAVGPADMPAVGDWVALEDAGADAAGVDAAGTDTAAPAVIAAVLPRRSAVIRAAADAARQGGRRLADEQVLAANVDVALLLAGLDGDLNLRRMERYLAVAWASGAEPVVVLNKADLADDAAGRRVAIEAVAPGVRILVVSALRGDGLDALAPVLRPRSTAVVLGSSGAGKSTLVNALLGEARQATGPVRADDSRGRHTTTHRELFALPGGALLIDTPGIRSLDVGGAEQGFDAAFDDVTALAATCRFADCRHEGEPGCAVGAAVDAGRLAPERLASHRKLERELAYEARRTDPRARARERQRWKAIGRAVDRHLDRKYGDDGP